MDRDSLLKGAEKVIRVCLNVQRGESLAVLADTPNLSVGLALCEAGRATGAEVSFLVADKERVEAVRAAGHALSSLHWLGRWFAGQYAPYFRAVSYIASTFSVGELSCRQCVGAKQYPPPGIMMSSVCRQ